MMIPNPLAHAAIKLVGYVAFGALIRRWSTRHDEGEPWYSVAGSAITFGAARLALGWLFGIPLLVMGMSKTDNDLALSYGLILIPRFVAWALLTHFWFRPRGGTRATILWALGGTVFSTAIDFAFLATYQQVSLFQDWWC